MPPTTHPALPGPLAAVLTVDPLLAERVSALHPAVHAVLLTRLSGTGEGVLRNTDGLLILAGPSGRDDSPAAARRIYLGTNLDDATAWTRAATLRAPCVMFLPDAAGELTQLIAAHLGIPA